MLIPMRFASRLALLLLPCLVFTANVYRACTQSITVDEAQTFNEFVNSPVARMFEAYDANHHVLHTYLCRISVALIGASEFSLRLPSLIGGLLYLVMAYRMCTLLLGQGLYALLTLGALTLNPLVMDHLSVARGYGLGLGLLMWGLFESIEWTGKPAKGALQRAGIAFGLSVSANLAYALPAAGLGGALLVMASRERKLRAVLVHLGIPAAVISALIVGPPLRTATAQTFYAGTDSWIESFERMFRDSFYSAAGPRSGIPFSTPLVSAAARGVIPAVLIAAILASLGAGLRWWRERSASGLDVRSRFLYFAGGAMALMAAANTLLHVAAKVPYPEPRSGLYWVVLITLAAAILIAKLPRPALRWPGYAAVAVCAVHFAFQWNVSDYREWRFDRRSKDIVRIIEQREAGRGRRVRIGATWVLSPSLNFYRTTRGLAWMDPVTRDVPNGRYDYYVLWQEDRALVGKLGLTLLFEDAIGAVTLATAPPR